MVKERDQAPAQTQRATTVPYREAMPPELDRSADDADRPHQTTADLAGQVDEDLDSFRASIDNIDAAIIHLLAERFKITRKVGEYKQRHQLPPADPEREAEQIARLRALAQDADLDPEFGEAVIRFIISEVIRHHEKARS